MTVLIKLLISFLACSRVLGQDASSAQPSASASASDSASSTDGVVSSGDASAASGASAEPTETPASSAASDSASSSGVTSQAGSPTSSPESVTPASTTVIQSGTDDLGWLHTISPPVLTPIPTTNADKITPTGQLPLATSSVNFNGDYSDTRLAQLWDDWVGPVQEPPLSVVPHPPSPYPLPNPPPPLFPPEYANAPCDILPGYKFPSDFLFGFATSAQQWEGAVKADGKGPSVWDWASRYPGFIADNTTSDVADLGYYLYEEDLARLAALGANAYSFSLFWSRILPFGFKDSPVNQAGLDFYQNLIDYAWSQGVEPVVTLYHWDTPLAMQLEYGGWASERIVDDFVNFAETVFRAYNGSVHKWVTFNEPAEVCGQILPPINSTLPGNLSDPLLYRYTCSYHLTIAHARTYHLFKELGITGQMAIKSDGFVGVPWRADSANDTEAVDRHEAYAIGLFAEPIYNSGDWPEIIKADLGPEILPRFNQSQIEMNKGTADFFALDGYKVGYVGAPANGIDACKNNQSDPNWPGCNLSYDYDSSAAAWAIGPFADPGVSWLVNTWPLLKANTESLIQRYPTEGGFYLSEYGFAEPGENAKGNIYQITEDPGRTGAIISYLTEVLKMICNDGLPIKGTFAWSIVDNFEWNNGFASRFGVQYVDYDSPTLQRTFKRSSLEMSQFWNAHRCDQ